MVESLLRLEFAIFHTMIFYPMYNKILIFFCIFIGFHCYSQSFSDYLSMEKCINKSRNDIRNNKYSKAEKILLKLDNPSMAIGLKMNLYRDLARISLQKKDFEQADSYFTKAIENGLVWKYLSYIIQQYPDTHTFEKQMNGVYDSILAIKLDNGGLALKKMLDKLYDDDQSIRHELMSLKNDSIKRELLTQKAHKIDENNRYIYDSIANQYGWVTRKMLIGEELKRDLQVILYHWDKENIYRYIDKGFSLAEENKVDWYEVINLQSYAIFKYADYVILENDSMNYVPKFNIKDKTNDKERFDFVLFSLAKDLKDGGTNHEGNIKRAFFYFNTDNAKIAKRTYQYMKKYLLKNGVESNQIIFHQSGAKYDSRFAEGQIGIRYR